MELSENADIGELYRTKTERKTKEKVEYDRS